MTHSRFFLGLVLLVGAVSGCALESITPTRAELRTDWEGSDALQDEESQSAFDARDQRTDCYLSPLYIGLYWGSFRDVHYEGFYSNNIYETNFGPELFEHTFVVDTDFDWIENPHQAGYFGGHGHAFQLMGAWEITSAWIEEKPNGSTMALRTEDYFVEFTPDMPGHYEVCYHREASPRNERPCATQYRVCVDINVSPSEGCGDGRCDPSECGDVGVPICGADCTPWDCD